MRGLSRRLSSRFFLIALLVLGMLLGLGWYLVMVDVNDISREEAYDLEEQRLIEFIGRDLGNGGLPKPDSDQEAHD